MGTGPFAVPAFEALTAAGYEIVSVVTRPAPPVRSRRGPPPSPVREFANSLSLPLIDPPSINDPAVIAELNSLRPDLLVVCDYGQILAGDTLAVARLGGINLHGSLLPAYRGAAPVQRALLAGDAVTGVSVIHMTPRLDGGPILASAETPILPDETAGELEYRLARLGVEPTLQATALLAVWDGHQPIGTPQDPTKVCRAPRLSKDEGRIDWSRTAAQLDWHIRGMSPWPGAFTELQIDPDKPPLRISIRQASALPSDEVWPTSPSAEFPPGTLRDDAELIIATGQGNLRIDRLQVAGRGEIGGNEFLRGYRLQRGARLGSDSA
ncbi:MAG: methionyl-tRNA formyltransferase [Planctomycetaceae bacterium]|nr:MAG: methionyl-tRNA formyltransferase [Planctomycetaceae bacterium]